MTLTITQRSTELAINAGRVALTAIFAMMLVAVFHPDVRTQVRGTIMKDFRMVVSTASGDLLGDGSKVTVAKIKTRDALFLEIYESKTNGSQVLVERIEMPHKKDGFFNFNGQATNLAIDDINGDGTLEILAPSFDQNLVGHLNIYRYNAGSRDFQRALR